MGVGGYFFFCTACYSLPTSGTVETVTKKEVIKRRLRKEEDQETVEEIEEVRCKGTVTRRQVEFK